MNTVKFQKGKTLVIAHRGLSGIEKENTVASFVAAGNRSYDGIETDVHRTGDGRFVINHNNTLEHVAGENIPVEEVSLDVLQGVVLYGMDGTKDRADLRPCSLENYIGVCKTYDKHCVLELKSVFTDEETARMIDIFRKLDYLDHVTFISFDYDNLLKIRKCLPTQPVQFLCSRVTDDIVERVIADGFDVDVEYVALTEENIRRFHEAGRKVNCWTVDRKEDAERLAAWGVDYITSNILE